MTKIEILSSVFRRSKEISELGLLIIATVFEVIVFPVYLKMSLDRFQVVDFCLCSSSCFEFQNYIRFFTVIHLKVYIFAGFASRGVSPANLLPRSTQPPQIIAKSSSGSAFWYVDILYQQRMFRTEISSLSWIFSISTASV